MRDLEEMLARYKRFREAGKRLSAKLVRHIPRPTMLECARKLGFLVKDQKRDVFVFDSEDEAAVLMDYAVHSLRAGGKTVLEWYIAESPPPADPDEAALLEAHRKARYSIFDVQHVERGYGMEMEDVFAGDTLFLMDVGFSGTAEPGMGMASRLYPLPGFYMTAGAALPVVPEALPEIEKRLIARFGRARANNLKNLSWVEQAALETIIIQSCLRSGASQQIRYEDVPRR